MKIAILGNSGFVGSNLKEKLHGHDFLLVSRKDGIDVLNQKVLVHLFRSFQPEVIYNLSSHGGSLHYVTEFAADVLRDNVQMTINVYEAAKSVPNCLVVNAISNCAYPGESDIQYEDKWLDGKVHDSVFSFGNGKRTLYAFSKCYAMQYKVRSCNLIFPNAFGIKDSIDPNHTHAIDGMIIRMIQAQREQKPQFEIWGTGSPVREWIYVEDFCDLLIQVPQKGERLEPLNMAQGKGYSIKESAEIIKKKLGYKGTLFFNPKYKDGAKIKVLDDTAFREEFPYYKFHDHETAIEKTIKYYEEVLS